MTAPATAKYPGSGSGTLTKIRLQACDWSNTENLANQWALSQNSGVQGAATQNPLQESLWPYPPPQQCRAWLGSVTSQGRQMGKIVFLGGREG